MNGPLEDVVVLDLTQQLAGPGGTMLLGDMGAIVIGSTHLPPRWWPMSHRRAWCRAKILAASRSQHGRSKRSISLISPNRKREKSFTRSRASADVVCQNYRPG